MYFDIGTGFLLREVHFPLTRARYERDMIWCETTLVLVCCVFFFRTCKWTVHSLAIFPFRVTTFGQDILAHVASF
jgi:hypothetical protein